MPQPALAHHPVRAGAVFQRAAGVEKQQHVVIAIAKLAVAAADAQGRTLDRSHGDAGQQADAHGQAEVAVIHDVGRHVGHGSTGFARGVRAFVRKMVAGVEFNECHVTVAPPVLKAASAKFIGKRRWLAPAASVRACARFTKVVRSLGRPRDCVHRPKRLSACFHAATRFLHAHCGTSATASQGTPGRLS